MFFYFLENKTSYLVNLEAEGSSLICNKNKVRKEINFNLDFLDTKNDGGWEEDLNVCDKLFIFKSKVA